MKRHFTLSLADRLNKSATSSRSADRLKHAFKGVLRAFNTIEVYYPAGTCNAPKKGFTRLLAL